MVGISAPLDVAGTSLADYVDGTQAAVVAFNERGGINGRCLDLKVCDGEGRRSDRAVLRPPGDRGHQRWSPGSRRRSSMSEGDAYQLFESAGLSQIGAQVTQPGAWNSPVSFEFTMGGSGTLLAGMPALKKVGVKKFVDLRPRQRTGRCAGRVRRIRW